MFKCQTLGCSTLVDRLQQTHGHHWLNGESKARQDQQLPITGGDEQYWRQALPAVSVDHYTSILYTGYLFSGSVINQQHTRISNIFPFRNQQYTFTLHIYRNVTNLNNAKNLPDKLNLNSCIHLSPRWPVILIESIFNRHYGILLNESLVHLKYLVRRKL